MTSTRPLLRHDGYLPLSDYGLIGDGRGCALVGRDGVIRWMCVPRFDTVPLFCGLLDRHGGGLRLRCSRPDLELHLLSDRVLDGLETTVRVGAGEDLWLLLRWEPRARRVPQVRPGRLLEETAAAWRPGTTVTPGSATRRSRCSRCAGSC